MLKKVLMTGLMITVMLSASACGKNSVGASGSVADTPVESPTDSQPTEAPQSTEAETQGTSEESPQPTEEPEEVTASYIFSDMPIAAYEVTGLGLGPNEAFYNERIIDAEDGYDYGIVQFVRLTPDENTRILFCFEGADENSYMSDATVHSPSGVGQWEANQYTCLDYFVNPMPEGYSELTRSGYHYKEESDGGEFQSMIDAWRKWILFAELYHPDAPQEDTIYVIQAVPYAYDENYDKAEEVAGSLAEAFERLGATLNEIPVEEALERCNAVVSEEGAD